MLIDLCLSRSLSEERTMENKNGGITAIFDSDSEKTKPALRRTFSADMFLNCSNGLSSPPRSEVDEMELEKNDFWTSITAEKSKELQGPPYGSSSLERSSSSLSQWSLEMCTESLGSETGSDEFGHRLENELPGSDEAVDRRKIVEDIASFVEVDIPVAKFYHSKKPPMRSIPPPIPTLNNENGSSLLIQSHRDNGKLVVEAVSVTNKYNFRTERQNGRLVLSLVGDEWSSEINDEDEHETESNEIHGEKVRPPMEPPPPPPPLILPINLNLNPFSFILEKKPRVLPNQNPKWRLPELEVEDDNLHAKETNTITRSIPTRPPLPPIKNKRPTENLNLYVKCSVPEVAYISTDRRRLPWNPTLVDHHDSIEISDGDERGKLLLLQDSKGQCYCTALQGCKERKRLLSVLKPRCIATT